MFSFIKKEEKKNVCVQSCPCHPPVGTGSAVPMRYATFKAGCSPGRVTPRENERRGMWQPIGRCWVAAWARGSFQQHHELEERLKRGGEGRGHGKGVQHCFWKAFAFRLSTHVSSAVPPQRQGLSLQSGMSCTPLLGWGGTRLWGLRGPGTQRRSPSCGGARGACAAWLPHPALRGASRGRCPGGSRVRPGAGRLQGSSTTLRAPRQISHGYKPKTY